MVGNLGKHRRFTSGFPLKRWYVEWPRRKERWEWLSSRIVFHYQWRIICLIHGKKCCIEATQAGRNWEFAWVQVMHHGQESLVPKLAVQHWVLLLRWRWHSELFKSVGLLRRYRHPWAPVYDLSAWRLHLYSKPRATIRWLSFLVG